MRRPTPAAEFAKILRKTGGLSRTIVIVFPVVPGRRSCASCARWELAGHFL